MKIRVGDITESTEEVEFEQAASELNPALKQGHGEEFRSEAPTSVRLTYYCAAQDLFFDGSIEAPLLGRCARCMEEFALEIEAGFHFLVTPREQTNETGGDEDVDFSVYEGEEVDLAPLIREQILLNLPTTPLCKEDCQGLCSRCGINRNRESCDCQQSEGDPRMALFRSLRVDR